MSKTSGHISKDLQKVFAFIMHPPSEVEELISILVRLDGVTLIISRDTMNSPLEGIGANLRGGTEKCGRSLILTP
jgi:hypothetical protein